MVAAIPNTATTPSTNCSLVPRPTANSSGIIQAAARMRPNGITDMEVKSFMKKWKDKKFAAGCDRPLILKGCELLGMDIREVAEICISGMKEHAEELQLCGNA